MGGRYRHAASIERASATGEAHDSAGRASTATAALTATSSPSAVSRAGAALHLTQPAVSRQVAQLEAQLGTQLVRRTRHGVHATEAGRLLAEHADAVLARLALAETQVGDLAGLRRGRVGLGSFFTALVYLSAELAGVLEARHPDLFRLQPDVIADELVDRPAAIRGLASGDLDVAIVFEHDAERAPAPDDVEVVHLFDDPLRALLPASHRRAALKSVRLADLAGDTWIRAHRGSAARLVDRVLRDARLAPSVLHAGHGDEPVEAQAFVAAGRGVTVAYDLNVVLDPERIAVVSLAGRAPVRHVQAAIMRGQRAPVPRAVLEALREVGERRAQRLARRGSGARRGARATKKRPPTGSPGAA